MKKKSLFVMFLIALSLSFFAVSGFAECKGGHCPLEKKCDGGGECSGHSGKQGGCPIAGRLMKKAHFYLENQKELGLKDDQIAAIKAIKTDAKKAEIRSAAEMQIFMMDMKSKLSEPTVDVEGLNKMIDEASAGMATSAKASVAAYAKLKGVLTNDQQAKAKEIWMQHEEGESVSN